MSQDEAGFAASTERGLGELNNTRFVLVLVLVLEIAC
jgi:hypothetical protein